MSHAPISKNHLFRLNSSISRLLMFAKPGVMSKKILVAGDAMGVPLDSALGRELHGAVTEERKRVSEEEIMRKKQPMKIWKGGERVDNPKLWRQKKVENYEVMGGGRYVRTEKGAEPLVRVAEGQYPKAPLIDKKRLKHALIGIEVKQTGKPDAPSFLQRAGSKFLEKKHSEARRALAAQAVINRNLVREIKKRDGDWRTGGVKSQSGKYTGKSRLSYDLTPAQEKELKAVRRKYDIADRRMMDEGFQKIRARAAAIEDDMKSRGVVVGRALGEDLPTAQRNTLDAFENLMKSDQDITGKATTSGVSALPSEAARNIRIQQRDKMRSEVAHRLGIDANRVDEVREKLNYLKNPSNVPEYITQVEAGKNAAIPWKGGSKRTAFNPTAAAEALASGGRPKGWKGKMPDVSRTSYPTLKKIGIAAGLIGGGVLAAKALSGRKKEDEQRKMLMSATGTAFQFARGDRLKDMFPSLRKEIEKQLAENGPHIGDLVRVRPGFSKWKAKKNKSMAKTAADMMRLRRKRVKEEYAGVQESIEDLRDTFSSPKSVLDVNDIAEGFSTRSIPGYSGSSPTGKHVPYKKGRVKSVKTAPPKKEKVAERPMVIEDVTENLGRVENEAAALRRENRRLLEENYGASIAVESAEAKARAAEAARIKSEDRISSAVEGARESLADKLGKQHAKQMYDEQSRRYKHVAIGTGAGLVGGAALGSSAMREAGENKSKQKQLRFERGEYDDAKRMAISSAVTGAAGGGIVASLLRPRDGNAFRKGGPAPKAAPLRKQFNRIGKAAFKAGAFMGAAGLASSLVGRAILGKPDKRDAASATKSGAVGGAVVGGLSGAALGALAGADPKKLAVFGLTKKAAGLVRRNKNWIPIAAMGNGGSARRALIGGAVGTLAGAAQMADEGQQADTLRNLKKPVKMSSKVRQIRFAEAPLSGKLAADRYRKRIQDEDLDRRDANIMRTMLAGAALGGVMKGRRGAAAGAGAGALLVPLIRTRTEAGKDMYGERTREGKRAEGIPWKAAALGAGALAAHKGINRVRGVANRFNVGAKNAKKAAKIAGLVGAGLIGANLLMNSKLKTIQFRDEEDIETDPEFLRNPEGSKEWRKGRIFANKAIVAGKRGTRLAKDVIRAVKGEKNVDSRGRERQREWDKPWVRNAILGTILTGGALASRRIVKGTGEGTVISGWRDAVQSGELRDALTHKMPRLAKAYNAITGYADDAVSETASAINQSSMAGRGLAWVKRNAAARREAKKAAVRAAGDEAASVIEAAKNNKIIEGKFSKPSNQRGVIHFISNEDRAPGWDTRREGDLVLLKDIRRRERREKKLLERKDWQDTVVTPAKMTASWLGGMGLMAILHKGGRAAGSRTSGGAGAAVTGDRSVYADKLREGIAEGAKRRAMGMSSVTKDLIALSSLLDDVL